MSRKLDQVLSDMTTNDRVAMAKQKTERVVDHLLYLLRLNANNEIVLYSSALSSQIPTSYAANAFNVFVVALGRFEIIRLCTLWDRPEIDKENIPIIVKLVDDAAVIETLVEETRSHWRQKGGELFISQCTGIRLVGHLTIVLVSRLRQCWQRKCCIAPFTNSASSIWDTTKNRCPTPALK